MWFIWWDICGVLCWLFGQLVTWGVNYALYTVVFDEFFKWSRWGIFHFVVFEIIILMIVVSHFRALLTDPGSVDRYTIAVSEIDRINAAALIRDENGVPIPKPRFCRKCECIKPSRAHHCSTCDRCIMRMDHHCPWVGNCVGQNNIKFFLQYVLYVCVGGCYSFCLFVYKAISCYYTPDYRKCGYDNVMTLVLWIVGAVMAMMFAIFTAMMFCDQYEGMTTDTTGIEAMKGWDELNVPFWRGMTAACGEPFGIRWFLPVSIPHSAQYHYDKNIPPETWNIRDPSIRKFFQRQSEKDDMERHDSDLRQRLVTKQVVSSDRSLDVLGQREDAELETPQPPGCARQHAHGDNKPAGKDDNAKTRKRQSTKYQ